MTKKILLFSIKKKQRKRTKPRCLYITTNIYTNVLDIYLQLLETFAFVDQTCIRLYTSINLQKLKFLHFSRKWTFNLQLHVNLKNICVVVLVVCILKIRERLAEYLNHCCIVLLFWKYLIKFISFRLCFCSLLHKKRNLCQC